MAVVARITEECRNLCASEGYQLDGVYSNMETPIPILCPFHGLGKRKVKQIRKRRLCLKCWHQRKDNFDSDCEFRVYRFFRLAGVSETDIVLHPKIPGTRLACDFYFPGPGLYLEVDGDQHWKYVRKWHRRKGDLVTQKTHDVEKTEWCLKNGQKLFRWCSDRVGSMAEIQAVWEASVSSGATHFISDPDRYPHLSH